jgi:hypothetical protein
MGKNKLMIPKTDAEKAAIKAAKRAYKEHQQPRILTSLEVAEKAKDPVYILTGILEEEELLSDDYPVYWDYLYVVDDNGGKVIRSDIQGTVKQLKADLRLQGYTANNIHRCNLTRRNIL